MKQTKWWMESVCLAHDSPWRGWPRSWQWWWCGWHGTLYSKGWREWWMNNSNMVSTRIWPPIRHGVIAAHSTPNEWLLSNGTRERLRLLQSWWWWTGTEWWRFCVLRVCVRNSGVCECVYEGRDANESPSMHFLYTILGHGIPRARTGLTKRRETKSNHNNNNKHTIHPSILRYTHTHIQA